MNRSTKWVVVLPVLCCYLASCSFFGPRTQTLVVNSEPSGAEVLISGALIGTTPLQHDVERGAPVLVQVRKPGYQTQYRNTSRTLSTLGIVDIIGGLFLLLPFLGLLSSAAWQHDPSTFGIILEPDK